VTLFPFHLAIPVVDLAAARAFYTERLGCEVGREADRWVDLNLYGHQVSLHLVDAGAAAPPTNPVDGDDVPVPHFGVVLPWEEWHAFSSLLRAKATEFVIAPRVRFQGEPGEQATFFLRDPSGNVLEFKSFQDPGRLFAR
jgi:extradiol dioxygenase family protein